MFKSLHFICIGLLLIAEISIGQTTVSRTDHHYFNNLEQGDSQNVWINLNTKKEDPLQPGNHYSFTDSKNPYGLGFETKIPDDLKKKNSCISVKARIRTRDTTQQVLLVTNILLGDSTILWKGIHLGNSRQPNAWVPVSDSLLIPANVPPGSNIKIYLWNQDGKAEADFDDLDIRFSSFRIPSYLIY